MAYATYAQYTAFMGGASYCSVSEADFPAYVARATDAIDYATMYKIDLYYGGVSGLDTFPAAQLVKATCLQVEYYGLNGIDEAVGITKGGGFTVGKVTVSEPSSGSSAKAQTICKAARNALAMTGLLYAGMGICD